ncbi:M23 family metallopeptidase [Streptomyces sp. GC420]|uniref:M23 family metallopeptidase n=1 Tax=Streptomyces sp. GC420 TaxID=2697568 RepID=UPI001414DCC3|nr:M23 family metallopeptidase [Streptomyces sp. GC420]NBM14171.1 peptidoglycan DD-metalloendopeptidase family protein [Streptomyces sp. GC420]
MAFTRTTGKHRRPTRPSRRSANLAGVAALTTTGVVGALSGPASAAAPAAAPSFEDTGLNRVLVIGETLADQIDAQAQAQRQAAEEAAAQAKAEAEAKKKAEEARRKAEARAKAEREAKERAARATERRLLNAYVAPVASALVSTSYQAGGAAWSSGSHTGVDFRAASGTSVRAVGGGTVVEAGWGGAYGNNIVIKMNDGTYTQYAHLSSVGVTVGQTVAPGQQIGLSGSTGNSSGPHLHFEARTSPEYGSDIDPLAYLRSHGVSV